MKKIITILIIAALAAALAISLVACNTGDDGGYTRPDGSFNPGGNGGFGELDTPEEIYGFSAASAGMLISAMNGDAAATAAAESTDIPADPGTGETPVDPGTGETPVDPGTGETPVDPGTGETPVDPGTGETPADPGTGTEAPSEPVVDNVTAELDGYMALVESLLSDGGFNVTTEASDREGYQVKSVVTYRDMHGNVIYYIEGIMIVDGAEYPIRGERSSESEPGESEEETEFIVTLSSTRRMVVEQSVETEDGEHEREYNYVIYEGRNVIERSTFEYEVEYGETEIEMTHYKDGVNTVFFFDKEMRHGKEVIRIRVGSTASPTASYIVNLVENADGTTSYTYERIGR